MLPFIPGRALPLLGYPVFWELLAGVSFLVGATVLIWWIITPPIFSSKNAKKYFQSLGNLISVGRDEDLVDLAGDTGSSIERIFEECSKYDRWAEKRAIEKKQNILLVRLLGMPLRSLICFQTNGSARR